MDAILCTAVTPESQVTASSSTPRGHRIPPGWTSSQYQNIDHRDFCDHEDDIWVTNLTEIGAQHKKAEKDGQSHFWVEIWKEDASVGRICPSERSTAFL